MFVFVGVFAVAWIWAALAHTWDIISPGTLPIGLHYMYIGAVSGSGFFNFLVWLPQVYPCSYKKEHNPILLLPSTTYELYSAPFEKDENDENNLYRKFEDGFSEGHSIKPNTE